MNVIAKISCYFERSVVTLKLRKEYLNTCDTQYTSLNPNKIINSLIYRTLFYVNIYGSYKLSKNSPGFFWPTLYFNWLSYRRGGGREPVPYRKILAPCAGLSFICMRCLNGRIRREQPSSELIFLDVLS